jgi:phosphoribosyl-dephospho-CoA transferase
MSETQFRILIAVLMAIAQAIKGSKEDKIFDKGMEQVVDLINRYNKECGK